MKLKKMEHDIYGAKEMAQNEYVVMGYKVSTQEAPQVDTISL